MTVDSLKSELSELLNAVKTGRDLISRVYEKLEETEQSFLGLALHTANTDRELRIAVVGQVKAGKSSFLNSLLFNGEEILPKAITPKTAALTIIKHGEKLRAEVEFYDSTEWQNILNNEQNYHQWIENERDRILNEQDGDNNRTPHRKKISFEKLSDDYFRGKVPEIYASAHELVNMVNDRKIKTELYLGTKTAFEAETTSELSDQLNDYVGANGRYTPLVKCSFLYYNLPQLDGVEVVDTPGLNDPVLSRGQLTKKFLAKCDVAFLLSYANQFLDQSDMNLLHEQLPEAGIKDVIVAGSKFDLLLKGERRKHDSIVKLLDNLEGSLRDRAKGEFNRRLQNASRDHERNMYSSILHSFEKVPVQFISAMSYAASQHYDNPSDEEKRLIDELNSLYPDSVEFDSETLLEFSNLGSNSSIQSTFNEKRSQKKRILAEKMDSFLAGQQEGLLRIREEIKKEALRGKERLQNGDIHALEERAKQINSRLKGGQGKIELAFEEGISGIKKKLSLLLTDMKEISTRFSRLDIKSEQKVEYYEVSTSSWYNPFSWGSSETRSRTITYRYADTHEAINKVEEYVIASEKQLKKTICELIDTAALKKDILEAVMKLFDLGDPDFDADNTIIIPVRIALAKIMVPDVELGDADYTKEITSKFSSGRVDENQVEALRAAQRSAITAVFKKFEATVSKESSRVITCLEKTQRDFTVDLVKDIIADLDNLKKQLKERELTLNRYDELLAIVEGGIQGGKARL